MFFCTFHHHYPDEMYTLFLTHLNNIMKYILLTILLLCSTAQAHKFDTEDYLEFVQTNGYWAMTEKTNRLIFCFGVDHNNKPACTGVPKRYIVIELPSNL